MERARRLWGHTDFRWLFLSQALSTTGDRIALVALAVLVTERTGSTADLGIVVGAQTAALVGFLLIGGVWADRLPRHRIMLATDIVRGGLHALVAVLILTDALVLWQLVAVEVCFGAAEAFFRPAYSGLVPQTVPEHLIQEANAANGLTKTLAEFGGPAIAAALVVVAGTGAAFAVDAATFGVSAALLALLRPRRRGEAPTRTSIASELRAGYREMRSRTWVWVTIAVFAIHLVVGYGTYVVLGPSIAEAHYGDAALWGWVAASIGLGTTTGSFIGMLWEPERPLLTGIVAVAPFGGFLLLYAAGMPFAVVLVAALVAGVGVALFAVWWSTALAQRIPPAALSRVSSFDLMGSYALLPLGYVVIGVVADHLGAPEVMACAGAIAILVLGLALLPPETRCLGQPEEERAAAVADVAL